jgi:hypothetical protein
MERDKSNSLYNVDQAGADFNFFDFQFNCNLQQLDNRPTTAPPTGCLEHNPSKPSWCGFAIRAQQIRDLKSLFKPIRLIFLLWESGTNYRQAMSTLSH